MLELFADCIERFQPCYIKKSIAKQNILEKRWHVVHLCMADIFHSMTTNMFENSFLKLVRLISSIIRPLVNKPQKHLIFIFLML